MPNRPATRLSSCSIISPLLRPGFGAPVSSAEVKPLNRLTSVGAARNSVRVRADSGIMARFAPRTYNRPMSAGVWRNGASASGCTR